MSNDQVILKARCLCHTCTFDIPVPASALPLKGSVCHCTSCRHLSGSLCSCCAYLPSNFEVPNFLGNSVTHLAKYAFTKDVTSLFCNVCGTPMFWLSSNEKYGPAIVYSGVLQDINKDIVTYERQIFIGDTKDGGASNWIVESDGVHGLRYKYGYTPPESEKVSLGWRCEEKSASAGGNSANAMIGASCHCRGVEFYITRPDEKSADPALTTQSTHSKGAWWLSGPKQDKYTASCCACDSCRLSAGAEFVCWAFVPRHNIRMPDGSEFDIEAFETLKMYKSSEKATWWFCGRCGANCFLVLEEARPNVLDVAAGLLWSAAEGARAEDWLVWEPKRFNRVDDGGGRPLVEALRRGFV